MYEKTTLYNLGWFFRLYNIILAKLKSNACNIKYVCYNMFRFGGSE